MIFRRFVLGWGFCLLAAHAQTITGSISGTIRDQKKYSDFRQFPNFHATFADNATVLYEELTKQ